MTTGELIRQARISAGLTQRELGERAGIAEPTIGRYELGKLNPKPATLKKIAAALGVHWYELLSDDPHKQSQGIVNDIFSRLQKNVATSGPMHKLSESEMANAGFIQFNSDDDKIAYLYSLLNDSGKFEAARCFFRHLDKDSIPEVIAYLQQLANTPQYQNQSKK